MNAMPAWGDREIARFTFRRGLFIRRGMAAAAAEALADRLALRDYERDDRRVCIECSSIQRGLKCFVHEQGHMKGVGRFFQVLPDTLQRCPHFTWQTP